MEKNKFDIIIVGGGLGGLTAGAKLAKEGKKVLLIEQHHIPGGCATTFKRKDYTMEVGLHEMDGLDENDQKTKIFNDLKVFDNVEFLRVPEFYHFKNEKINITIPDNTIKAIEVLIKKFPKEKKGIEQFFKVIHKIQKEVNHLPEKKWQQILLLPFFPALFPYLSICSSKFTKFTSLLNPLFWLLHPNLIFWKYQNLGDFLDAIIDDDDLKLVLNANLQYYHDDPYSMSLIYFSVAQASFYNGGHFIKGGSQKLSNYLAKIITKNNGEILLSKKVTDIIIENDTKAVGVKYQNTFSKDSKKETINADIIIANTAIPNVIDLLSSEKTKKILKTKTLKLEKTCSLLSIYIGFKKEVKELGNKNYSTFVFDKSVKSQKDMIANHHGNFDKRNFVFVDYSQVDSGLTPKGKSFGVICTVDYLSDWENLSKEEYKQKKEKVAQIFFKRLEKEIPGIFNEIDYYEVGTSKTIKRYTLNPEGAVYGFAQTPEQAGMFRMQNKSSVKNLYFASAWAMPGGGFTGAILSGSFCANEILRK